MHAVLKNCGGKRISRVSAG